jgi:hypothetical protein
VLSSETCHAQFRSSNSWKTVNEHFGYQESEIFSLFKELQESSLSNIAVNKKKDV